MKKGFTIIELMIVIAIVGILMAIVLPKFIELNSKSHCEEAPRGKECARFVDAAIRARNRYRLEWIIENIPRHSEKAREALDALTSRSAPAQPASTPTQPASAPAQDPEKEKRLAECRSLVAEIEQLRLECLKKKSELDFLNAPRGECMELDSVEACMKRGGF